MKSIIVLILSLWVLNACAQTEKVIKSDLEADVREEYHVLKIDSNIKQGYYAKYKPFMNRIICDGYYTNNKKDSLWRYYYMGRLIVESGYYKKGKKVGVWEGLNSDGSRDITYDYTNHKLLFAANRYTDTTIQYNVIKGNDTTLISLDRSPIYLEGQGRLLNAIMLNLKYPYPLTKRGVVLAAFTINTDGSVSNYKIIRSVSPGLDTEALKAVKSIDGDWLPGMQNGNMVRVEQVVPISFLTK